MYALRLFCEKLFGPSEILLNTISCIGRTVRCFRHPPPHFLCTDESVSCCRAASTRRAFHHQRTNRVHLLLLISLHSALAVQRVRGGAGDSGENSTPPAKSVHSHYIRDSVMENWVTEFLPHFSLARHGLYFPMPPLPPPYTYRNPAVFCARPRSFGPVFSGERNATLHEQGRDTGAALEIWSQSWLALLPW